MDFVQVLNCFRFCIDFRKRSAVLFFATGIGWRYTCRWNCTFKKTRSFSFVAVPSLVWEVVWSQKILYDLLPLSSGSARLLEGIGSSLLPGRFYMYKS